MSHHFINLTRFISHFACYQKGRQSIGFLLLVCLHFNLNAQSGIDHTGTPFIRNYTPEEYKAHNQNWAIAQDHRGIMYFGNNHGILEFDGVSWRLIKTKKENIVRSLGISHDSIVYVGGFGEIGYLAPDSIDQLKYISLLDHLELRYHDFSDVWQTLATSEGIFFITPQYIFRWDGEKMHTWTSPAGYHVGFVVHDQLYVRQKQTGLMLIHGDKISLAPHGDIFADERIMAMLPYPSKSNKEILIATRSKGLMLYDGSSAKPFATEADAILTDGLVYCGARLTGESFAFGTLQDGVVIIDQNGNIRHHLNKSSGLQDETIWYLYPDRQGGLWTGMHVGISRIETSAPHTFFGEREGLEGSVLNILRHNQILYAATSMGIYYLDERTFRFRRIETVAPQTWAMAAYKDNVLAATFEGVFEIKGIEGKLIDSVYAMSIARSLQDPDRIYIGMQSGFKSLYNSGGKWINEGYVDGIDQEIDVIYENPPGKVWLTTRKTEILLLDYSKRDFANPVITVFDSSHGLPVGDRTLAFSTAQGMRFGTNRGIYKFDEGKKYFTLDTTIIKGLKTEDADIYNVTTGVKGNLWIISNVISGVGWLQPDDTYVWDTRPFMRIAGLDSYYAYRDPASDQILWIGSIDRIIRFDENVKKDIAAPYSTLTRNVLVNGDSVLFGGAGNLIDRIVLRNNYRSLRFNYAAMSYDEAQKNVFQYILEGYDDRWSAWTHETYKDYTGLPAGHYVFKVRAKNIYGQESDTSSVAFKILPPFYFTWWAILFYSFAFAGIVYFLWKKQLRKIEHAHDLHIKELEFEKLKELDQLKSQFFADISHEFRTPLTLILGPVDKLLDEQPTSEQAKQYSLIRRNAQRLLRLINQLLDLSKLDAGKMKLEMEYADIIPTVKGISESFESLAHSKHVGLTITSNVPHALINFDRDKMEQIISNLVSNAIKFTNEGGHVSIVVNEDPKEQLLLIEVKDTGDGIVKEHLPHVFDRFYQASPASKSGEPGTGIGLALAKELVELHRGHIRVSSIEGKGTSFIISLPFDREYKLSGSFPTRNGHRTIALQEVPDESVITSNRDDLASDNKLLLVEDNPDMRSFIRETLSGTYSIIEAVDGEDGIEKAIQHIPDIIVSDVMMPKKDGLELCKFLKNDERTSHIPVILLTAKADIESRLAGLERGADDYLAKPFNRKEILIRAKNLLEIRKRLWERNTALKPREAEKAPEDKVQIEDAFMIKIRNLVEQNMSESEFEIEGLSQQAGMSRSQLFRKIKALTGLSPSVFIRSIRLQKARELLQSSDLNVSEVAYKVGFSSPAYFSDAFAEMYQVRPSQIKK